MQFKMAKNSIFAYLLRSPWWMSLLIALIVAAVARYFLTGIFGQAVVSIAFPFFLISGMAGWRQLQTPSAARIEATLTAVSAMSWQQFSTALQQGFEREGYEVTRSKGAADFLLKKDGRRTLVFCKRWKAASHGVEPLHALESAREALDVHAAIYVATSALTENARIFAATNGIRVMGGADLAGLLRK